MIGFHHVKAQSIFGGKAMDSCFKRQIIKSIGGKSFPCIFLAMPYLLISQDFRYATDTSIGTDFHPIRALVQSAYRADSLYSREQSQVVRRMMEYGENTLVYVPQVWILILGGLSLLQLFGSWLMVDRSSHYLRSKSTSH